MITSVLITGWIKGKGITGLWLPRRAFRAVSGHWLYYERSDSVKIETFWAICSALSAIYAMYLLIFEKDVPSATFMMN